MIPKKHRFQHLVHIRAVLEGFLTNPDIAILDTYGEAALLMWFLLRLFKPDTKIVAVFHHYESLSVRSSNSRVVTMIYCRLIDYITKILLKNSDKILTVSLASARELSNLLRIPDSNKIVVVGCSNSDNLSGLVTNGPKDLDFLCVGRFEKFDGIEDIWNIIKKQKPESKFVVVGHASSRDINRLKAIGIDHKEIVSEEEKFQLYSRAKVFIFPSMFEGFGIAITEALSARLSIIAWKLPVFEERFGRESINNLKLVETGNTTLFAHEALIALGDYDKSCNQLLGHQHIFKVTKTWDDVGRHVISVLNKLS